MTFYNGYVMIGKQEQEDEMAFFKKKGTQTGPEISLLPAQPPAGMVPFVPMISRQVVELNSSIAF